MESIKTTLVKAVIKMLHPLAQMLLRYEVSHSEFTELAKRAYVDVAYKYFSIPNRKQTYSRVAVLTGLSRKEVVRLSQVDEEQPPPEKGPLNRAKRVISGWLQDQDFLDDNNEPKDLALRGEGATFEELVARYSGDITARAILDELIRVGAVSKLDKDTVRLTHHGFIPGKSEPAKINVLSTHATDLLSTAVHNLTHDDKDARFQRQVTYTDIPDSVIEEFKQYSHDKSLDLLRDFDRWLAEKKRTVEPGADEKTGRVGVGIYYFKNDN
ncbi:MAG: DUF6502 family protein [Gammaproteobacteria bacterium]|jgi:hypothetical protein